MREVEYDRDVSLEGGSSAIKRAVYDTDSRQLYIVFPGGRIAGYGHVSPDEYDNFITASSVGSYYSRYIKGQYPGINTSDIVFTKRRVVEPVKDHKDTNAYDVQIVYTTTVRLNADNLSEVQDLVESLYNDAEILEVKKV